MPDHLPVEDFNLPESKLLGFIYDQSGKLVWRSTSAQDESVDYSPKYDGMIDEFTRTRDA